jgi:hypothetical protein
MYGDGQVWVVHKDRDFHTDATSFRALVHRTANSRGQKAETVISKDKKSVTFRFYDA